jgi:putative oxygen-independent coproporphyrinogen III oxidase
MAGLYLHIPFCKQACYYCNFHFSTSEKDYQPMVNAMLHEMELRKDYLREPLQSIYLGGGTPSVLSPSQLDQLFNRINQLFSIEKDAEVTLEANPDDLTREKIMELKASPVTRLSIGVQSFFEEDLKWMNRAHTSQQAKDCIRFAKEKGFDHLTIDLIYGMPSLTDEKWLSNIQETLQFGIDHISSYALTVEAQTALDHFIRNKKSLPVNEEQSAQQFELLVSTLEQHAFEQYEISNFARKHKYAVHNTNYWKNRPYLGIGPSAHSFNNHSRSWNIANNTKYMQGIHSGIPNLETEILTPQNQLNEYLMTGLRTMWGCNLRDISQRFGAHSSSHIADQIQDPKYANLIEINGSIFKLSRKGRLFADGIAAELFV